MATESHQLSVDRKKMVAAVTQDWLALETASEEVRNDREVALAAIAVDGLALRYASSNLQSDRDVVLAAVASNGLSLWYAAEHLRSDKTLVLTAIAQDWRALSLAASLDLAVELARDNDFLTRYFSDIYVFVVTTLSGRSCVVATGDNDHGQPAAEYCLRATIARISCQRLGLENVDIDRVELLLLGEPVPASDTCDSWPGVLPGCTIELQMVVAA
mmetsp:Transcript_43138/g.99388  ORF Transcript_43138/g.99388 Transcript_43138/m.99388 type:complete len:216 (-) Transcript_43138:121-768(-)